MSAGAYDLNLVQGGVYRRTFRFLDDGTPRSLVGCTVRAQVRKKEDPNSTLLLDLGAYMTLSGDTVTLTVPSSATAALRANDFKEAAWDLWVFDASGDPGEGPLLAGAAALDPSATQLASP